MPDALRVDQTGPGTTVQDRGRVGYRGFGVPLGGAFDRASQDLANALVGNHLDAATLELTLWGGNFTCALPIAIGLAGAPMEGWIQSSEGQDRQRLTIPQSAQLQPGDHLILRGTPLGARTYLAVAGGWRTPLILGSRSTETRLEPGQWLDAEAGITATRRPVAVPWPSMNDADPVRVIDGPDGDARLLEAGRYRVTEQSNRMGLRLEGPSIDARADADRLSSPVAPGAIQITGGQPILLGVAGGTMGGYLHLAHVISVDLDRIAQARPGQSLRFLRIEVEEARELDKDRRRALAAWLNVIRDHSI